MALMLVIPKISVSGRSACTIWLILEAPKPARNCCYIFFHKLVFNLADLFSPYLSNLVNPAIELGKDNVN